MRSWALAVALAGAVLYFAAARPAQQRDQVEAWTEAVAQDHQLQDSAFQGFRTGQDGQAADALAAYLTYLETIRPLVGKWEPGSSPWLDAEALAHERMLTAGRLASVLEQAGESARAEALWSRALSYAQESGRADVSVESVREVVEMSRPPADLPGAVH